MKPWIDLAHRLIYRLGHPLARLWWRLTGGKAVGAAVVLRSGGEILVLRESYRRGLGLPAGGQDKGETPLETAARELYEEVGISLPADKLVMVQRQSFESEGRSIDNTLFEAWLDRPVEPTIDRREIVWAGWMRCDAIGLDAAQPALRLYLEHIRA